MPKKLLLFHQEFHDFHQKIQDGFHCLFLPLNEVGNQLCGKGGRGGPFVIGDVSGFQLEREAMCSLFPVVFCMTAFVSTTS